MVTRKLKVGANCMQSEIKKCSLVQQSLGSKETFIVSDAKYPVINLKQLVWDSFSISLLSTYWTTFPELIQVKLVPRSNVFIWPLTGKLDFHGQLISQFYPTCKIRNKFMHAKITVYNMIREFQCLKHDAKPTEAVAWNQIDSLHIKPKRPGEHGNPIKSM